MTTTRFILTGGLVLRLAVDGPAAAEPLVFIHALGCDLDLWAAVAAPLAARHRVIRYDLRGHGLSDCGPPECTMEDHARDLAGALDALGADRATLIGISVGGMVAQSFAGLFPTRVRRLVLCATGARLGSRESWSERMALLQTHGLAGMADAVLARWFTPDFAAREPALVRGWRNRLVRTPVEGYLATCAALREADLRGTAPAIGVSTLVIAGERDVAAPPDAGRELAGLVPGALFEMIRGVGHLPPLENPAAVLALLGPFLDTPP